MYQLNEEIVAVFPKYFATAKITKECEIKTFSETRSNLLIKFESPLKISVTEETVGPIIDILLNGDKQLSELYKDCNSSLVKIKTGLRWISDTDNQFIEIIGLSLNITLNRSYNHDLQHENLIKPLIDFKLILDDDAAQDLLLAGIKTAYRSELQSNQFAPRIFSSNISKNSAYHSLTEKGRNYIQNCISIVQRSNLKIYAGENSINPAYENLEQVRYHLHSNEKRIWLLRSDFNIILGIKNAYQEMWGYHGLYDAFEDKNHQYIDWNDRVGHPSLALPDSENKYDGGVYYAGHIAQRDGYLEVVDNSGRFDRPDLSDDKLEKLEAWLALQFQKAFGEQRVVFIPHPRRNTYDADYYELSLFYTNKQLSEKKVKKREYSSDNISEILNDDNLNNEKALQFAC